MPGANMSKPLKHNASREQTATTMQEEAADLWAMCYGFADAQELKAWGEEAERDRIGELRAAKDRPTPSCD